MKVRGARSGVPGSRPEEKTQTQAKRPKRKKEQLETGNEEAVTRNEEGVTNNE
jgi:hypothetical protein